METYMKAQDGEVAARAGDAGEFVSEEASERPSDEEGDQSTEHGSDASIRSGRMHVKGRPQQSYGLHHLPGGGTLVSGTSVSHLTTLKFHFSH